MSSTESPPSRTGEIRHDAVFDRWVLISPARSRRPSDFKSRSPASSSNTNPKPSCAFCAGHERECAPEIFRLPPASTTDWKIRVIENLYPALSRDAEPSPSPVDGLLAAAPGRCAVTGFGFHDVVIETPDHSVRLPDLSLAEVGEVLLAHKQRILQLARLGSIKYVQVFKNYGASAGASMAHSHSQIMGLPLVPPLVSTRLDSMKKFYDMTGKCCLCEAWSEDILVSETAHFFAIVPFAASYPFEVWIVPRDHTNHFHEIDNEKAVDLGGLLKLVLQKLSKQLNDPPYNFMIQTAPLALSSSCAHYTHWFLQIIPHLSVIGGFEIGTGCFINPVFPEDAAMVLREADCSK
ncbi:ADP-glucose phosphorylase [Canna indica]|uniref:ADP-glucose phosphorylase n=1 Tax=Canna indica TaxID=4628 RepID=A0AAQ3K030_9LILI|nr:ADP-glucose phosphorylase [Canna indica]